jgi:ABC-2 type transport system ATP-binding protein
VANAPAATPAVTIRHVVKRFGDKVALADVNLDIPTGSFFGICGPNGAGKTTLLRSCTGLLRPDQGQLLVDGIDVWGQPLEAKRRMGLVPDTPNLFERLSGHELLTFTGLLRGMDPEVVAVRASELLHVLRLDHDASTLVADYSLGMTKKVALAAALIHAPKVLFLDEPFSAIDPVSTQVIEEILRRFIDAGGTVVFSSHVMDVVEQLCDRIAIINHGRVIVTGAITDISGGRRLQDVFVEMVGGHADLEATELRWLSSSSG